MRDCDHEMDLDTGCCFECGEDLACVAYSASPHTAYLQAENDLLHAMRGNYGPANRRIDQIIAHQQPEEDEPVAISTTTTRRAAVWDLLSDKRWHTTMEICAVAVGGSEGCRRLRELRKECRAGKRVPFSDIGKRKALVGTQYEYCLVEHGTVAHPGGLQPPPRRPPGKNR